MTIRNLDALFKPRSVALLGASAAPSSVGAVLAANLLSGGFAGRVMLVNPRHRQVGGERCYSSVEQLPEAPDLAVIATPPDSVPGLVASLGARGTRAAVVITAGFAETGTAAGRQRQQQLLDAARPQLLRVVGPNCVGLLAPGIGLNASFAHLDAEPGKLAFIAQSGAILTAMLDWAKPRNIGFSCLASLGDMCDVDFGDLLDYLALDRGTSAILLYVEAITSPRKFISAARAAARMKPVIVVKGGRGAAGATAAASHTGALAGSDAVFDAVFRRTGMLRVASLAELFDAAEALATLRQPRGDRLYVVTNGGGMGVLAADALSERGGELAALTPEITARLDAVLPATWSRANPIDIIGDAPPGRYAQALEALAATATGDTLLAIHCPTALASASDSARAVIDFQERHPAQAVLASWVGDYTAGAARELFATQGIPSFATPEQAIRAFMTVIGYRRGRDILMQTPPSVPELFTPDRQRAREPITAALQDGRCWLTEAESKAVLRAYGIPAVVGRSARTPDEAAAIAAELQTPVALKIISTDLSHKSDVGGVVLNLADPATVRAAAGAMLTRLQQTAPAARLQGFSVQPMVQRPGAYELIVGMVDDAQFGPVMLFGQGGTAVEVIDDKALGLPPLNMRLAAELMSRTRIHHLLRGYRDMPAADLDAIALTLIKAAQLVSDMPEIVEMDINPLLADAQGVIALDARLRVQQADGGGQRLAIRPYPRELEEHIALGDGRQLLLRPVVPEDEPALQAAFAKLNAREVYLRFFAPLRSLSHLMATRFTQLDYDREMALMLTAPGIPGQTELYGMVNLSCDPDNERAEYGLLVREDMTGMGLGILLMRRIIDYARQRGIGEIVGDVLRENRTMLKLCTFLGFTVAARPDDAAVVRVSLRLAR